MPFLRPPVYAWLLRPLLWLAPLQAATLWLGLQVIAALAAAIWAARRMNTPEVLLLLAMFPPLLVAIITGQDTPLLLLTSLLLLLLLERRRDMAAAVPLAALWLKPTLLPAFVVFVIAQRRWRTLAGFALLSAGLWAAAPPGPYVEFLRNVWGTPGVPACVPCMPNVRALLPAAAAVVASAMLLALLYLLASRAPLPLGFALACGVAVAASLYSHVYDCLFLLPAIAVAGRKQRGVVIILALALSPLPWLMPYWSESLRRVPALMTLATLIAVAYATRVAISSPRSAAYREALSSDQR